MQTTTKVVDTQSKPQGLVENGSPDDLVKFYQFLMSNDISFNEYADSLRESCKYICKVKGLEFIDLDEQLEDDGKLPIERKVESKHPLQETFEDNVREAEEDTDDIDPDDIEQEIL